MNVSPLLSSPLLSSPLLFSFSAWHGMYPLPALQPAWGYHIGISYYHIAGKIFLWLRLKLIRSKVLILSERGCKNPINEVRDTQEGNQIEVVAMVSVSVDRRKQQIDFTTLLPYLHVANRKDISSTACVCYLCSI